MSEMTLVVALPRRCRSSSRSETPSKMRRETRVRAMERMTGSLRGWRSGGDLAAGVACLGATRRGAYGVRGVGDSFDFISGGGVGGGVDGADCVGGLSAV